MKRAVESVLRQDYIGDIEVIVVFDACPVDDPMVRVGAGRTLRLVENHRSRGLAGARNTGILEASNPYVAFLDDDDFWYEQKLTSQMGLFADQADRVLIGSAIVLNDGEKQIERLAPSSMITYQDLLHDRIPGLHSSTFVADRSKLIGIGMVDELLPGSYGEDYDLLLRVAQMSPIALVNQPLVSVTWATSSLFFGRWRAYADGLEYLLSRHPDFELHRKACGRIEAQIAFARAAAKQGQTARSWAFRAIRHDPTQIKAWLAIAVSLKVLRTEWITAAAQKRGRGI